MLRRHFYPHAVRTRTARSLDQRSRLPYDRGAACALVERSRDGGVALLHRGDLEAAAGSAPRAGGAARRLADRLRSARVPGDAGREPDADVRAGRADGLDEEP